MSAISTPHDKISVIITVLNEGESIDRLLDSFTRQTCVADEIVIVDGGSRDDTVARIERFRDRLNIQLIVQAGCNISEGRNLAVQHATHAILAITDAGVSLPHTWLADVTQPLRDNSSPTVACGFFEADPHTIFEVAMGATVLPLRDEINPVTFLPSSRSVAIRRAAYLEVGGYPEWLDYCEDLVFDLRLKATQPPFAFAPQAVVKFRPRESFGAFYRQYYRYARGDGKADLWFKRHLIRYVMYGVALPILFIGGFSYPLCWGVLLLGGFAYIYRPFRRLPHVMQQAPHKGIGAWLMCLALIPLIRVVGDVAKMLGYPVGRVWRWRNQPPTWKVAG